MAVYLEEPYIYIYIYLYIHYFLFRAMKCRTSASVLIRLWELSGALLAKVANIVKA